ncbi:AraC family transcriptional regulator [Gordonia sp. LSe1-13]|uniref:AraC family transcriptional regulator n=1 Tax=Gordonia sesuvii TaxID=3116777 RepID=A0ABU7M6S5_9ACTN|nr:AraC family transcriptional regulator [Gordonia sp. LSe1-13]
MSRLEQMRIPGDPDWDAASAAVSDAYFPHQLNPRESRSSASQADVSLTVIGPLRIARIGWGAEVAIHTDHPGAYGINVPLGGVLETQVGGHSVVSTSGLATINPPDTPADITRWSSTCSIVGVKIDRDFLRHEMDRVGGGPDVTIPDQLDLRAPAGESWFRLVRSIAAQPADDPLLANPLVAEQLAASLTDAFLLAALPDDPVDHHLPRPRIVTRVLDALRADPARPWTAADMADVAGVSVRRLQEGFREYVGRTPRDCLTEIRLAAVHDELRAGATSVTDVAMKWGFTHTGRFAAAFRRKYGVPPSALLREL